MAIDLSMFFATDEEGTETELPRPETKSWPDVIQCINHWQGQPKGEPVIDRFIEMYLLGLQWDWYELGYKPWLEACEKVQAWNNARIPDEETGELPEPMPEPEMPARPDFETVAEVRLRKNVHNIYQDNATTRQDRQVYEQLKTALAEKPFDNILPNLDQG